MGNNMDKDAYWFHHDANAKRDPKIMLLRHELGAEGYGLYWMLVEDLREQSSYSLPIKLVPALAKEYGTTETKLDAVVRGYGLFEVKDEAIFYSPSLIRRMARWETNKELNRARAKKAAEARWAKALGAESADNDVMHKQNTSNTQAMHKHSGSNADVMQSDAIRGEERRGEERRREERRREETKKDVAAVCDFYGINELNDFGNYRSVAQFITLLANTGQLPRFREQFPAYIRFKEKSGEKRHRLQSFMGDPKNQYQDGGWNAANWVEELKTLPAKSGSDLLSQMKNI